MTASEQASINHLSIKKGMASEESLKGTETLGIPHTYLPMKLKKNIFKSHTTHCKKTQVNSAVIPHGRQVPS
jgi:hypothetical protein